MEPEAAEERYSREGMRPEQRQELGKEQTHQLPRVIPGPGSDWLGSL